MTASRPPDFYVLVESGARIPCYLQGQLDESRPHLLIGFQAGRSSTAPFLIHAEAKRLVTWAGTLLDLEIEPANSEVWQALTC
jgi:hypothetical protein